MALFRTLEKKHRRELDDAPPERRKPHGRPRSVPRSPVPLWRWIAATLVVLLAAICVSIWIDNHVELIGNYFGGSNYWGFSYMQAGTLWGAGFVAGCIVQRWPAVMLALLPIVVAIPFGVTDYDGFHLPNDPVVYYLAALAPFCAAFIAAGVTVGAWVAGSPRRRDSAPATG